MALITKNNYMQISLDKIRVYDKDGEIARLQLNDDYELEVFKTKDLSAEVKRTASSALIRTSAIKKSTSTLDPDTAEWAVVDSDTDSFLNLKYVIDTDNNYIVAKEYA
jgi:hypothetical protein